jgi:hypothetical protein
MPAEERTDEGRAAADQAEEGETAPGGAAAGGRHRRDDAEPLGGVVRTEADDQQDREPDLTLGGGVADGTRPLGATAGDFVSKPVAKGGLGYGTIGASLILAAVLLALIAYQTRRPSTAPAMP